MFLFDLVGLLLGAIVPIVIVVLVLAIATGSFGYFPSYATGSAYAAQFVRAMGEDGVDLAAACEAGDLSEPNGWLARNVWRWGRAKDPAEIVPDACGEPFDAGCYCSYLTEKFSELYGL